ncbi:hypothetical protein MKX03_002561 [Papaver bracteatum]|nr:hypothetical protein MKX03_002561 [Papaver bracteatum]
MDSFLFGNTLNNLNESGFFEISSGSPTASDVGNSLNNLDELPWDVLLSRRVDPDSRKVIRKEIIRRCPDFETKLYGDQWNLIHLASEYGHLEIVKVLLISTTNGDESVCSALCSRSCPLLTQLYFCVLTRQTDDLMEELNKMSYEFEPAKRQEHIYPYPLHDVSTWGYIHMVELILIYGSGLSSVCLLKDTDGETPLHCAAQTGRVSVINMLLSTCWECAGMVSDKRNETALHCALRNNQTKAFKALLEWYIIKEEFLNNNARDWEFLNSSDLFQTNFNWWELQSSHYHNYGSESKLLCEGGMVPVYCIQLFL